MNEQDTTRSADAATIARLEQLAARRAAVSPASSSSAARPTARPRRNHPSKKARVGALGLSLAATAGLTSLFASAAAARSTTTAASGTSGTSGTVTASGMVTASGTAASTAGAPVAAPSTTAGTASAPSASAAAGTVDGAVEANKYGNVQVEVTFANGAISSVNVLQSPNRDGKSVNINNRAVPTLNSEAVTAQSANVHTVSGATYTSDSYAKSLQSAIDTARASGITALK